MHVSGAPIKKRVERSEELPPSRLARLRPSMACQASRLPMLSPFASLKTLAAV